MIRPRRARSTLEGKQERERTRVIIATGRLFIVKEGFFFVLPVRGQTLRVISRSTEMKILDALLDVACAAKLLVELNFELTFPPSFPPTVKT